MIVAELEVYHSRPVAPTRRVALGRQQLPVDPAPGLGGVLLGGIVARFVGSIDPDLLPDLVRLTHQLEDGRRIPQPRLRHRLQKDRVGLQRSTHRLFDADGELRFGFDDAHGHPAQQVLAAVYAAGEVRPGARPAVMGTIRRAVTWQGPVGPELITVLSGFSTGSSLTAEALANPVEWAMAVLGFAVPAGPAATADDRGPGTGGSSAGGAGRGAGRAASGGPAADGRNGSGVGASTEAGHDAANGSRAGAATGSTTGPVNGWSNGSGRPATADGRGPTKAEIQRQYRRMLIAAHPDHGGATGDAARRIADLSEARKILLG